ncbi:hypothetical protein Dimus_017221 [Dionaea muscipula]
MLMLAFFQYLIWLALKETHLRPFLVRSSYSGRALPCPTNQVSCRRRRDGTIVANHPPAIAIATAPPLHHSTSSLAPSPRRQRAKTNNLRSQMVGGRKWRRGGARL